MRTMRMSRHPAYICTLGAAGHGKTAVTRALLKRLNPSDLDRTEAVLRSHHYKLCTAAREFQLYDPTADQAAKYLSSQVSGLDGAILVISARDGVTAETSHHVRLAKFCGVETIIPFLNKCDLSESRQTERKRANAVAELLSAHAFRRFDVFPMGACGPDANDHSKAPIEMLIQMMDRNFRSRFDRGVES